MNSIALYVYQSTTSLTAIFWISVAIFFSSLFVWLYGKLREDSDLAFQAWVILWVSGIIAPLSAYGLSTLSFTPKTKPYIALTQEGIYYCGGFLSEWIDVDSIEWNEIYLNASRRKDVLIITLKNEQKITIDCCGLTHTAREISKFITDNESLSGMKWHTCDPTDKKSPEELIENSMMQ